MELDILSYILNSPFLMTPNIIILCETPSLTRGWVVSYECAWPLSSVHVAHIA
jgi:hypothetical protein